MEFGAILVNHGVGNDNPTHCGVFVKENARTKLSSILELTDTRGRFWTVLNDRGSQLEVDSHIDFEAYLQDYNEKLKAVANG